MHIQNHLKLPIGDISLVEFAEWVSHLEGPSRIWANQYLGTLIHKVSWHIPYYTFTGYFHNFLHNLFHMTTLVMTSVNSDQKWPDPPPSVFVSPGFAYTYMFNVMVTETSNIDFDQTNKHIITWCGNSWNGHHGMFCFWLDKNEYEKYLTLQKTISVKSALDNLGKKLLNPPLRLTDRFLARIEPKEWELPYVQDYLLPYFLKEGIHPPFAYHRRGTFFVGTVDTIEGINKEKFAMDIRWDNFKGTDYYYFWTTRDIGVYLKLKLPAHIKFMVT